MEYADGKSDSTTTATEQKFDEKPFGSIFFVAVLANAKIHFIFILLNNLTVAVDKECDAP